MSRRGSIIQPRVSGGDTLGNESGTINHTLKGFHKG